MPVDYNIPGPYTPMATAYSDSYTTLKTGLEQQVVPPELMPEPWDGLPGSGGAVRPASGIVYPIIT